MKKLLIAIVLLTPVLNSSAKSSRNSSSFKIGIGGGFNSTWLFNTNVNNTGDGLNYKASFGGQAGVNMTYDFQETMGLGVGILFSGCNQKYDVGQGFLEIETSLKYIDIPILLRIGSMSQGAYFEVGPQIGILTSATEDATTSPASSKDYTGKDIKSQFNGLDFAGVLGVGGSFDVGDKLGMTIGLRFGYSFTDATVQHSEDDLKQLEKDGTSSFTNFAGHYSYKEDPVTHQQIFDYKPTNRAFGGLFVSLMYSID